MIHIDDVSFWYHGQEVPTLDRVHLHIEEGELALLVGRTGSGKSTLLGTINGQVPHFTGGHLEGDVLVAGISTHSRPPREFAHIVGVVGQDPLASFVTDTVEDELAYGMEQLGMRPDVMRRRVEETLDLLGIAELRRRALRTLSGGQQQRVAIGAVLTPHPQVLVLDEPTSALDPTAAEEVLATLARLVQDLGTTVLLAEHRVERVLPFADSIIHIDGEGHVTNGSPAAMMETSTIAPPIIQLGRLCGWRPLPLAVRDARRAASEVRRELDALPTDGATKVTHADVALHSHDVVVRYGPTVAVRGVDLDLHQGEILAMMGRNGSGKSSLLWALQGSGPRQGGTVEVGGHDPKQLAAAQARKFVGLVPQTASDLLYLESVDQECEASDRESGVEPGTCRALLDSIAPGIAGDHHPRDLSEGQRLSLVLAVQLTAAPPVLLLDEPTRGLDYAAKQALAYVLKRLAKEGHAIAVATHDVEFVATVADTAIVMAEGEVVSAGDVRDVLGASPAFAPQVAKILSHRWLLVSEVAEALPRLEAAHGLS